jgi:hypothetical protein
MRHPKCFAFRRRKKKTIIFKLGGFDIKKQISIVMEIDSKQKI